MSARTYPANANKATAVALLLRDTGATVGDICDATGLTHQNATSWVRSLESAGVCRVAGVRARSGAGAKAFVYRLQTGSAK